MTELRGVYALWRHKAKRFARFHGFFWLPCDLCGEPYGGQEANGSIFLSHDGGGETWRGICPYCTAERQQAAERKLAELGVEFTANGGASSTGRAGPTHRLPFEGRIPDYYAFDQKERQ